MQRYPVSLLLLFVSIVFLVLPAPVVQGAAAPTTRPAAGKEAAAAAATPNQKTAKPAVSASTKKQPTVRTKPTPAAPAIATPSKSTTRQTVSRRAPTKPASSADARKVERKSTAVASTATRQATTSPQKKVARKKKSQAPAAPLPVAGQAEIDKLISSRSAIIMDAHTGEELFAKYPDNPRQPASTIKIVTAMIALKSLKQDDIIDVSDHAAGMPSSKIFLDPNKQYRANDLINAVLLASANDASVALAEKIAGSEDNFANLMTLSAKMWGARNTVCRTASGLTALGQQSTARDLANLFRYAMQDDEFARRMHEKFISTSYGKVLRNHNKALWRLDGAMGGKTGYTVAARQTYVGQFSRDNQTIVVAIMGSESMWGDLEKLVNYGFDKKKEEQLARIGSNAAASQATRVN